MTDLTGRKLGQYEITAWLGRGGMADVYRAVQPSIGREVAVKILPREFLHDPAFLERFNREVRIIANLKHPRVLPVYDFGEQDGLPFIVMAYMEGGSLADLIRQAPGGMDIEEVVRLTGQIAEGLDYAHRRGIIHRDFKPSNVLLDEEGNIYLGDFGIAKAIESTAQLTGSGIVGTPLYMAPEMAQPGGVTPLVDVYALGVAVYQMLTGRAPYEADTPIGLLMAHAVNPIPNVRALRPGLPEAVQRVIEQAMAKDPAQRYQSAGGLAAGLRSAVAGAQPAPAPLPVVLPAGEPTPGGPAALPEALPSLPPDPEVTYAEAQAVPPAGPAPVSYTHLTLPTIYSV